MKMEYEGNQDESKVELEKPKEKANVPTLESIGRDFDNAMSKIGEQIRESFVNFNNGNEIERIN